MKLVTGAGETSEPHALETVMSLEVSEAHFNALSFITRLEKRFGLHLAPSEIPSIFIDIAQDPARRHFRAPD